MAKVHLSPELQIDTEQFLNALALLDISEIRAFSGQIDDILHKKNGDSLSEEEKERITKANLELTSEIHQRHRNLLDKQLEKTLTAAEEAEFQQLDKRIQDSNANRLKHLRFLSHIRDIPFEKLVEQYGLYLSQQTCLLIEHALEANRKRKESARELLRKMRIEGDAEEQRETWEYLKVALDEDRLSSRKLFP